MLCQAKAVEKLRAARLPAQLAPEPMPSPIDDNVSQHLQVSLTKREATPHQVGHACQARFRWRCIRLETLQGFNSCLKPLVLQSNSRSARLQAIYFASAVLQLQR